MTSRLVPVDEPAVSLNDRRAATAPTPGWRDRLRAALDRVRGTDRYGAVQFAATGSFVYGSVAYFGAPLGCLIVGATGFLAAVVLESFGGE